MTTCWQQLLNEGDYIGAYISQQCPCFIPGDGSWADFYFRLLHHVEQPRRHHRWSDEGEFLQCVSATTQQPQLPYKDYWKLYMELSRLYQQPIQASVFFGSFLQHSPMDLARAMAQRGDVQGLLVVSSHASSLQKMSWIEELPITLPPREILPIVSLVCQNDNDNNNRDDVFERLVRKMYNYTRQARPCLELIHHALDYCYKSNKKSMDALQKLREEFILLSSQDEHGEETVHARQTTNMSSSPPAAVPTDNDKKNGRVHEEHNTVDFKEYKSCQTRAKCHVVKSPPTTIPIHPSNPRHDVNQVSFSSADTMVDDDNTNEIHSSHFNDDKDLQIQQLEETVQRLQTELQQQAQEHALERMGDKARIDYFLTIMNHDECHGETRRVPTPYGETSDLHVALELSEQGRIRAVQELQQERELYAQKLQQLMRLAVQQQQGGQEQVGT